MLKVLTYYDKDTTSAKFKDISRHLTALLLHVSSATRARMYESGVIRTQMGKHSRGRHAWDALYDSTRKQ
jgi:hypothetical protein